MTKSPAFQLYAADLLVDTIEWDINEVGIYTRLLMAQWANGDLPDDGERLSRIAGCSPKRFTKWSEKVLGKFINKPDGRLINLRLEETRKNQEEYRNKAIESGRKGGLKSQKERRECSSDPSSDPSSNPSSDPSSENRALQSSTSSLKKDKALKAPEAALILPSKEEIQESSDPKIEEYIQQVCARLYEEKIFPEVHAFKNKMVKGKKNGRGVLHVLTRCYIAKPKDPWGYCQKIISIEDGNYNERDYRKTAQ